MWIDLGNASSEIHQWWTGPADFIFRNQRVCYDHDWQHVSFLDLLRSHLQERERESSSADGSKTDEIRPAEGIFPTCYWKDVAMSSQGRKQHSLWSSSAEQASENKIRKETRTVKNRSHGQYRLLLSRLELVSGKKRVYLCRWRTPPRAQVTANRNAGPKPKLDIPVTSYVRKKILVALAAILHILFWENGVRGCIWSRLITRWKEGI